MDAAEKFNDFALYVHIPYCVAKCPYCDFNSYAVSSWPEREYVRSLAREMQKRSLEPPWRGTHVKTIFFGGGTPSLFDPASIAEIIEAADRCFGIADGAEITLEANPGTVDRGKLRELRRAGVNRVSLGAQSFNPRVLRFLGRIHSADETRRAVRAVFEAGFDRLNLDVMFAIPGQTCADVEADIREAVRLGPDHISAYNLTFEEGTRFGAALRAGRMRTLDEDLQAEMYALVRRMLPADGYDQYEISNFAPKGHECRHNLSYWKRKSYLGLGAGAHSFADDAVGGRRFWNERSPRGYMRAVRDRGTGEVGGEKIDPALAAAEFVILNLRLTEGFSRRGFEERFRQSFENRFGPVAARLVDCGLLVADDEQIRLSERGLELADSVFLEFLSVDERDGAMKSTLDDAVESGRERSHHRALPAQ